MALILSVLFFGDVKQNVMCDIWNAMLMTTVDGKVTI